MRAPAPEVSVGRCALTGRQGRFVKAHLVPKAFYAGGGQVMSYASDASRRPKRAPIGLYDTSLVIESTEREIFMPIDNYGVRFLRQQEAYWLDLDPGAVEAGWTVSGANYSLLKQFFNSLLWRAAASSRIEPPLELGPRALELHSLVSSRAAGACHDFAVSLIFYPDLRHELVMLPILREIDGVLGALAILGKAEVLWYIDQPPREVELMRLLRDSEPLLILRRPWRGSRPEAMLTSLADNNGLI